MRISSPQPARISDRMIQSLAGAAGEYLREWEGEIMSKKIAQVLVRPSGFDTSRYEVWADEGQLEIIKTIPGVSLVFCQLEKGEYAVYFDPRYDAQSIIDDIVGTLTH